MESYHHTRPAYYCQRYLYPSQYIISEGWIPAQSGDYFNVSGFQTPVGRKFVDATAGEYDKQLYEYSDGYDDSKSFNLSDQLTGHTRLEGALNAAGYGTRLINYSYPNASQYSDEVYNKALTKLYENVRLSESNLALSIGEARESGRLLKVGKSLSDIVVMARRAKRQVLLNPSKTLSELWLSWKYGWQPLYSDVYNYLHWAYTSFNEGIPVVGRSRQTRTVSDNLGSLTAPLGLSMISGKVEHKAEIKCLIGLADNDTYNLSRITSLNPLSIVWELIPLSFVADWFYDVGGYLQNMEAALGAGVTFKRGYTSEVAYHDLEDHVIREATEPSGYGYFVNNRSYKCKWLRARKRRNQLLALPFPRAPTLKVNLGSQRIMSAAALIRVILLGRAR